MTSRTSNNVRRGGLTPVETSLFGCGTLAAVFIVCCGLAIYWGVRNVKAGMSSDPKEIRGWLQEELKCDPPKGYECVRGFRANVMGSLTATIIVAPPDASIGERFEPDPKKTVFQIMKGPMMDQARTGEMPGRTEHSKADVELKVSEKKVKAVKAEVTLNDVKSVEYRIPLRKTLIVVAVGPAEGFDMKAMEDFLGVMRLDQPFDLPTAVKESAHADKK